MISLFAYSWRDSSQIFYFHGCQESGHLHWAMHRWTHEDEALKITWRKVYRSMPLLHCCNASCYTVCGIKVIFESDLIQDFLCVPQLGSQVQKIIFLFTDISLAFRMLSLHRLLPNHQKFLKSLKLVSLYDCQEEKLVKYSWAKSHRLLNYMRYLCWQ